MHTARLNAERVLKALHAAFCHDAGRQELLQMTATRMREAGSPYDGVYLYMLHDDRLVLEAFDGSPTDLQEIPVGAGLCGRAVSEKRDLNVADVATESAYLSCGLDTRSELIVLIRRGEEILGEIDIDCNRVGGFPENEHAAARRVADGLASLL